MHKTAITILLQASGIVIAAAVLAMATNQIRADGIPLVTDIEYEIFAPCKDSDAESQAADAKALAAQASGTVLYIDARPAAAYAEEHAKGSLNIPYSVLFGASNADIERVKQEALARQAAAIVVYGLYADSGDTAQVVDLAKPLAQQLVEAGIAGVKHLEGGMDELKKTGIETVKRAGGTD